MRYDMIPHDAVKRVMDAFYAHSASINEKYKTFRKDGDIDDSDRDRFVSRFFKKYCGRFFALADKDIIASSYNGYLMAVKPESIYCSGRMQGNWNTSASEPVLRVRRRYLWIRGFRAVNELYGIGFIEMDCLDVFGNKVHIRIDVNNLNHMQFRTISSDEFEAIAHLFDDDRDDIPFKVTRYLDYDEMKARKIKRKHLVKETIEVMAKDIEDAGKKVTNAIEVEMV